MHAKVWRLMRDTVRLDVGGANREAGLKEPRLKIALLRRHQGVEGRTIVNYNETAAVLFWAGFTYREPSALSFASQVAMFREASAVCTIMGSGMAGLMYAPASVRVLILTPNEYVIPYYNPFIQTLAGMYAIVHGYVTKNENPTKNYRSASFQIDAEALRHGLGALGLA
jgi:capsular polysaccharide biosynthesis protein